MSPKDAFHTTVHAAPGGCESLAPRMGMSPAILRNKANLTSNFNKPTLEDIDLAMALTGDYRILDALAGKHGRVCIQIEEGAGANDMAVLEIMTKCWAANGDVGSEVMRALEDGRIDHKEIAAIKDAVLKVNQSMQRLLARLEGMAG